MKRTWKFFWRLSLSGLVGLLSAPLGATPTLSFVTHPLPPYSYEQRGHAAGPMVEILALACERLGISCQTRVLPWRRALSLAEQGQVEGIFSVIDIPQRRQQLHLLRPVLSLHYTFFAPQSSSFSYTNPESLRGYQIAAYGPSGISSLLLETVKTLPDTEVKVVLDNPTALKMLAAGRFGPKGLVLANENVAQNLISISGLDGIRKAGVFKSLAYTFGLSRANNMITPELAESFNRALARLCREGVVSQIAARHGLRAASCGSP